MSMSGKQTWPDLDEKESKQRRLLGTWPDDKGSLSGSTVMSFIMPPTSSLALYFNSFQQFYTFCVLSAFQTPLMPSTELSCGNEGVSNNVIIKGVSGYNTKH